MKNTRKLFMLGLMLLAVMGVNKFNPREVKAANPESESTIVTLKGPLSFTKVGISEDKIAKVTITNDANKLKENPIDGTPLNVTYIPSGGGANRKGSKRVVVMPAVRAYLYVSEENENLYDCVIYSDVEKIVAYADSSGMFSGYAALTEIVIDDSIKFDTSKVTDMSNMFYGCSSLTKLDLSNFNTSKVTDMSGMFYGCSSLTELDISSFDMSKVTNTSNMLYVMDNLQQIKTPKNLGNNTIKLPETFTLLDSINGERITKIDSSMTNIVITQTSKGLVELVETINALNTCDDYAQATSLRVQYAALDAADKEVFEKFKNSDDVLLIDKLEYMEYMLSIKGEKTSGNQMLETLENNDYNVITIAVLTLTSFIGIAGYYIIQKRKSIKA